MMDTGHETHWRISKDAHNWILSYSFWSEKHGEVRWRRDKFFNRLPELCSYALQQNMGPGPWDDSESLQTSLNSAALILADRLTMETPA